MMMVITTKAEQDRGNREAEAKNEAKKAAKQADELKEIEGL